MLIIFHILIHCILHGIVMHVSSIILVTSILLLKWFF